MVLKSFISRVSSWIVSRVAKSGFITNGLKETAVIVNLTNKDNLVTRITNWDGNIFLL
jgi:hypothetical protein